MPITKDDAIRLGSELLALDVKARENGTSVVDLLTALARNTYGVDVRPTAEDIEAASAPEEEALELEPAEPANTQEGGAA